MVKQGHHRNEVGIGQFNSNAEVFATHESNVRTYCRHFGGIFVRARGAYVYDASGKRYIDLLMGAGALNYGHNHPVIKDRVIRYLSDDGIVQGLDLHTLAKQTFLENLNDIILEPRRLHYKVAFTGPTGTNAIELALKYARRVTGRSQVVAFTGAFHGMTLGSLAATANRYKREGAGISLQNVVRVPFEGYLGPDVDTIEVLERMLQDPGSGIDPPAAVVVETVQAEGGLNVASGQWLERLASVTHSHGALLIIDDVQAGCGRTGTFFSFEEASVTPDLICLSKSLGGIGFPIAVVLLKPEYDTLLPGQHNGTFRGHGPAFVAGAAALELWRSEEFRRGVRRVCSALTDGLSGIVQRFPQLGAVVKGRGALVGISWEEPWVAKAVSARAYSGGVIAETSGAHDQVLKLLPALTMSPEELADALDLIEQAVADVVTCAPATGRKVLRNPQR